MSKILILKPPLQKILTEFPKIIWISQNLTLALQAVFSRKTKTIKLRCATNLQSYCKQKSVQNIIDKVWNFCKQQLKVEHRIIENRVRFLIRISHKKRFKSVKIFIDLFHCKFLTPKLKAMFAKFKILSHSTKVKHLKRLSKVAIQDKQIR